MDAEKIEVEDLSGTVEIPKKLIKELRCSDCGSLMVEYDGWTYANLPLNTSEGIGNSWCGACESSEAGSDDDPDDEKLAQWVEYRAESGMDTLEQADQDFLNTARGQLADLTKERERLEANLAAWEKELRS